MTAKLIWICDGCDEQKEVVEGQPNNWKPYVLTMDNAKGYPIYSSAEVITVNTHLCPTCAKQMAELIRPRLWARPQSAPNPTPSGAP